MPPAYVPISAENRHRARVFLSAVIVLCASCFSGCGVRQDKFRALDRDAEALRRCTSTSISQEEYRTLLQTLTAELTAARVNASNDRERAIVYRFEAARDAYADALSVWDGAPMDTPVRLATASLEMIRRRYWLPADAVTVGAARQTIWSHANQLFDEAHAILNEN